MHHFNTVQRLRLSSHLKKNASHGGHPHQASCVAVAAPHRYVIETDIATIQQGPARAPQRNVRRGCARQQGV
jgi:hypothetical protein